MSIQEIIAQESDNNSKIMLRREGLFWKAYEVSAYQFVMLVKEYRSVKKHYKAADYQVVSLGFPDPQLENILTLASGIPGSSTEHGEKLVTIHLEDPDVSGFVNWKDEIPLVDQERNSHDVEPSILERIRCFPVASNSPLEAQAFIVELQTEIHHGKI